MNVKFYCIFGGVLLMSGLITSSFVYVIRSERRLKELQQQNLIYQANEKQYKRELENSNAMIQALNSQLNNQKRLVQEKEDSLRKAREEVKSLTIQEQINIINSVFNS